MTTVCEIAFPAATGRASAPESAADAVRRWMALPGLRTLDLYTPAAVSAADPYVNDGPAPAAFAVLAFESADEVQRATATPAFAAGLAALPGAAVTCTAMQRIDYAVAGQTAPSPLRATFSYVVRYHRPAEDEALFVRNYLDDHPPILARLPEIRNVICYVPLAAARYPSLPAADYMLGNEVVFDNAAAFNAAMASPVRHELRAHFRRFPPFTGKNTHHPMERRRLLG